MRPLSRLQLRPVLPPSIASRSRYDIQNIGKRDGRSIQRSFTERNKWASGMRLCGYAERQRVMPEDELSSPSATGNERRLTCYCFEWRAVTVPVIVDCRAVMPHRADGVPETTPAAVVSVASSLRRAGRVNFPAAGRSSEPDGCRHLVRWSCEAGISPRSTATRPVILFAGNVYGRCTAATVAPTVAVADG